MPATIKIKNSSTASAVPTSSDLVQGELAVNVTDRRLFTENASGTVVELGTNPTILTMGAAGSASAPVITRTGDTNTGIFFPAADTIAFAEGGTEAMRLDSSGNMGLGVTPSAWNSDYKSVAVSNYAEFYGRVATPSVGVSYNIYRNSGGSWIYKTTNAAARYEQDSGYHLWFTAPSGTAGASASFTQAMTLDASGNLGVGTTSMAPAGSRKGFVLRGNANGTELIIQSTSATDGTSEGMALVAAGTDCSLINRLNGFMTFNTNNTERARIDSSGNLLVGTTSGTGNGERVFISASNGSFATRIYNYLGTTPSGFLMYYPNVAPNGTGSPFFTGADNSVTRAEFRSNGGLANYSANNVNLSDRREKTNFAPAKSYLDVICAIPVQTYNYIDQNLEEDDGLTLGVVAQDVQAVAPELVAESDWSSEKDGSKMRLSIYQTDMQYALMKSIQELKAIVDAQAARITALEQA